jgi:hypothetical protein
MGCFENVRGWTVRPPMTTGTHGKGPASAETEVSDCAKSDFPELSAGDIPTVVITRGRSRCDDDTREHKGILFYGYEPQAWWCLASDEIASFKAWATHRFPAVLLLEVKTSLDCPPPNPNVIAHHEMRVKLRELAKQWFVAPRSPAPTLQAAVDTPRTISLT